MSRRNWSAYNPVASSDEIEDTESPGTQLENTSPENETRTPDPAPLRRSQEEQDQELPGSKQEAEAAAYLESSVLYSVEKNSIGTESKSDSERTIRNRITVVVLDAAQKRFPIDVDPDWKVKTFKDAGYKVHKVAPVSQRLIFRGRMLDDSKSLKEAGIFEDDAIVHLFPKPRVTVVSNSSGEGTQLSANQENHDGAHVPQIVLDREEQERRGQILVLGSYEVAEAQNNVRLLSLLLGTICVMRLLALLAVASGADQVPVYQEDDNIPSDISNNTDGSLYPHVDYEPRRWQNQDYFDLVVSSVGFLVARLGMKATYENTSRMAALYLIGTLTAGILWNIWNIFGFVAFVEEQGEPKDDDDVMPLTNDDIRTLALFTVILPLGVWLLCCARAWQFRHLIEEAETEAAERIRSELTLTNNGAQLSTAAEDTLPLELGEFDSNPHQTTA